MNKFRSVNLIRYVKKEKINEYFNFQELYITSFMLFYLWKEKG